MQFWAEMEEAATTAEKLQRGSFLLERLKPKSTEYKDKWAVDVYRNSPAARAEKNSSVYSSRGACSKMTMFTVCKLLKKC